MSKEYELSDRFQPTNSLCAPSSQTKLIYALESNNFEEFEKTLKTGLREGTVQLNYTYEKPRNKTLLEVACSSCNKCKFVDALIKNGANVNSVNFVLKKAALHLAVEFSDVETIKLIVDNRHTDINICDRSGNTPLHLAASLNKINVIDILLNHPGIKVNEVNRKNQTPLHLALQKDNKDSVAALLKNIDVDLDDIKDFSDQTCREMIRNKYPDIEMRTTGGSGKSHSSLFNILKNRDLRSLQVEARANRGRLDEDDGLETLLQYACANGLCEAVQILLDNGASPSKTCVGNSKYPIMIAGFQGFSSIVRVLVEHKTGIKYYDEAEGTVLHAVLRGMLMCIDTLGSSSGEARNHLNCLEYLLQKVPQKDMNINYQDERGDTALHFAVNLNDDHIIRMLLDNGAYVGYRNKLGHMPISFMNSKTFKQYLDDCITTNGERAIDSKYEIIYNYRFLAPPYICVETEVETGSQTILEIETTDTYDVISETAPLVEMSRVPELRPLLKHPVLTSFLNLKWYTIRKYFYINLSFYVAFWAFLSCYIMSAYGAPPTIPGNQATETATFERYKTVLWFPTLVLCAVFSVRELFQFSVSPRKYFTSFENLLEISLIAFTFTILFCKSNFLESQTQIAAFAILLSWTELVLLIGRHPQLSTNIEMFKVVCWNFLKFLAWYALLILAFALSFFLLFKDSKKVAPDGANTAESEQVFQYPGTSLFKSVIMLTGEFDASSIPFDSRPGTSHLLFILFVFLIAIVLFNLLNGLAVSDTQAIRRDAELVGNVCRAKLISYMEAMAVGDPFPCFNLMDKLTCLCCCVPAHSARRRPRRKAIRRARERREKHIKMFYSRINLFPNILSDMAAHVLPNEGNIVNFSTLRSKNEQKNCFTNCVSWFIDPEIMKSAKEILASNAMKTVQFSDNDDVMRRYALQLEEYKLKLKSLDETSKRTETQLNEIIDLLRRKF